LTAELPLLGESIVPIGALGPDLDFQSFPKATSWKRPVRVFSRFAGFPSKLGVPLLVLFEHQREAVRFRISVDETRSIAKKCGVGGSTIG
jgi:hypothetical protein